MQITEKAKEFKKDISKKLKRAGVYAATALVLLSGNAMAQDKKQDTESKIPYMKEFAQFVHQMETDNPELAEKIKKDPTTGYKIFAEKMAKMDAEQKKTEGQTVERKTFDDTFSIKDLSPKGLELYNALVISKSLQGQVTGRRSMSAMTDVRTAMLKIKHSEPELHQEIIQKAFGKTKYNEEKGIVEMQGKDGTTYTMKTRKAGEKPLPAAAFFKARQNSY